MAEKKGFLVKEGGQIRSWKKRWCVLKNGGLHYSKSHTSGDLGVINLSTAGVIKVSDARPKKKFCFEISTPARTYYMCAESSSELSSWVKELNLEKDRLTGGSGSSGGSAGSSSNSSALGHSAGVTTNGSANGSKVDSRASQTPAEPAKKMVVLEDFDILKVIGRGSFGKVLQVRKKDNKKIYAMKVLNKKSIIEKAEVDHTKAEQSILQKLCHPFLVNLNYSFQTPDKLYFIMDYINGGELFFHLQNDKKFPEERVRFYAAEIACGLEYLHSCGVLYRDLKPENILLTSDGHICMTDFGISKEGLHSDDARTATFCGTPEYLAPEVLEGTGYGKGVDWWSFGTLVFEMLTGLPPFYAQDVQQMYAKIISAKLVVPPSVSPDAKSLIEELLVRQPEKRLSDPAKIKAHPFFKGIDWDLLVKKEMTPPFIPPVKNAEDTSQIDTTFTQEDAALSHEDASAISEADQANFSGFAYVAPNSS
jgi:serine/threonine protein kinase